MSAECAPPSATIRARLDEASKAALRAGEKPRLRVLRMVSAAVKQVAIDARKEPTDAEVLTLFDKMIKQRRDAEAQYAAAGRRDLADQEALEIGIIQGFMPPPLSETEIDRLISEALAAVPAAGPRDARAMGRVMGWIQPRARGRADLGQISAKVRACLAKDDV